MDQQKAGSFLKELRKEKGITQEELAEKLCVSRRTVSRWETGSNMPDLDLLIELADFYDTDIREILNGERKSEQMDKDLKDTLTEVAAYTNEEKLCKVSWFSKICIGGVISAVIYLILLFLEPEKTSGAYDFFEGFFLGIALNASLVGAIMCYRYAAELKEIKKRIERK